MDIASACVRVIDDDPAVLSVLGRLAESAGFFTRLYDSAEHFISEDETSEPGCVLVDLMLPGLSGADLAEWIQQQLNPLPIIIVTGYGTVPSAVHCLKRGAVDFLEKPIDTDLLVTAIRRAVEKNFEQEEANQRAIEVKQNYASLSEREKEILSGLSRGMLSKQIANRLSLSVRTVEKHRINIMKKMHADSLAKLLRSMIEIGL